MVSQGPKSRAGRRTMSAPDWLMGMLADHLVRRGITGAEPEAFVFVGPDGHPLHYSNWRQRVWLPATEAAGLKGMRFHDLRHTAGTALEISDVAPTASFDVVRDQGPIRVLGFSAVAATS